MYHVTEYLELANFVACSRPHGSLNPAGNRHKSYKCIDIGSLDRSDLNDFAREQLATKMCHILDSCPMKYYFDHAFDTNLLLNTYTSVTTPKEVIQDMVIEPMKKLQSLFASGGFGGDTLIDISFGHTIFQLFPVCEFFKEIILLDPADQSLESLRKWVTKDPDAHDWSYVSKLAAELRNKSESVQDVDDMVRKKVKDIAKCYLKENPSCDLELPKADCVIALQTLDIISKDDHAFLRNLKYLSSLLKVGGHLILLADIETSCFMVGNDQYHVLSYDENFLKKALDDEGYLIKCYESIGKEDTTKLYDIKKTMFVAAQKK